MKKLIVILSFLGCIVFYNSYGQNKLIKPLWKNDLKKVQKLIDKGSDVNGHSILCSPLMFSVLKGNKEMVELLLRNGAKSDTCKAKSVINHLDLYDQFKSLEFGDKRILFTPFYYAIKTNQINMVKLFCDFDYDVTKKMGGLQYTFPILAATEFGNDDVFSFLLEKGVDVTVKDYNGKNALMLSASINNLERAKLFIQKGCNINDSSNTGYTPLMYAAELRESNIEIVDLLINHGADLNYFNSIKQSAFSLACLHNKYLVALYLFEHGAKAFDSEGLFESNARVNHFLGDYYMAKGSLDSSKVNYKKAEQYYYSSINENKKALSKIRKAQRTNFLIDALAGAAMNTLATTQANY
jgi:ankyrin repeat protein